MVKLVVLMAAIVAENNADAVLMNRVRINLGETDILKYSYQQNNLKTLFEKYQLRCEEEVKQQKVNVDQKKKPDCTNAKTYCEGTFYLDPALKGTCTELDDTNDANLEMARKCDKASKDVKDGTMTCGDAIAACMAPHNTLVTTGTMDMSSGDMGISYDMYDKCEGGKDAGWDVYPKSRLCAGSKLQTTDPKFPNDKYQVNLEADSEYTRWASECEAPKTPDTDKTDKEASAAALLKCQKSIAALGDTPKDEACTTAQTDCTNPSGKNIKICNTQSDMDAADKKCTGKKLAETNKTQCAAKTSEKETSSSGSQKSF